MRKYRSRARSALASTVAVLFTLALVPSAFAAGDRPVDAPPHPEALAAAAAAGETTFTFDEAARRARLRVDDGYDLDQYRFGDQSPISFQIDLQGLDPDGGGSGPVSLAGGQPIRLRMQVFDVDQAGSDDCGPEVDKVSVNGKSVGTLSGANDQWSVNTFTLPAGTLTSGTNGFNVDIDTSGTGCWAVEVAWAEVEVAFNIAQLAADATDDVTIRRGKTDDEIPDRVWEREFDASGNLSAPTKDDPIADEMGGGAGKLSYGYSIGAWPSKPKWEPTVRAGWSWSDGGGTGTGPAAGTKGWDGKLVIDVPKRTGKYKLTVWVEVLKDGKSLHKQERTHEVYVLFGKPVGGGLRLPRTATPKSAWLDRAFEWGAGGWTAPKIILQTLMIRIYRNPLHWSYTTAPHNSAAELIEGTGTRGECFTFRDVWRVLALSLGIDVDYRDYGRTLIGDPPNFLTRTRPALDGNASANAGPVGGSLQERWSFSTHGWGTFGGDRYDPTFGLTGPDTTAAFEADSVYCKQQGGFGAGGSWVCRELAASGAAVLVTPTGGTSAGGWSIDQFAPMTPFQRLQAPSSSRAALALAAPGDAGLDPDGNGQFEQLRFDLPVTAPSDATYTVVATLSTAAGVPFARGTLQPDTGSADVLQTRLAAGEHTVPVYFSGLAIRAASADGPYLVNAEIRADDGTVIGTVAHATKPYDHRAFQGQLATVGTITDAVVGDQLRVSVPVTPTGPGRIEIRSHLFAGETQLGTDARELTVGTAPETVGLDFPTGPLWAAGIDGPYVVHISVRDALYGSKHEHTTASYDADAFTPPPISIGSGVTDAGGDTDGDTRFETLDVTAPVAARVSGPAVLDGALVTAEGRLIASERAELTAGPAPQPVTLRFDGREIARLGVDGPYDVMLSVSDGDDNEQMRRTHRSGAYAATAFARPVAMLRGTYADSAVDVNGDGHADTLRVEVGVDLADAAEYTLSGTLVDSDGRRVADATTTEEVDVGQTTMRLDFDGGVLRESGRNGPYRLTGVDLGRSGEAPATSALDVHTTAAYAASTFRPGTPFYIERIADRGVDADGDGRFDQLAIDVVVQVNDDDVYAANARLVDAQGDEIQWAGSQAFFDVGEHTLTIAFDGRRISGRAVDGPYRVEDLTLYANPDAPITMREPYLTAAYQATQFELGAVIAGHVRSDRKPVEGALIAVPGRAYDFTDAAGAYRLALPEGGPSEVTITADPALAPWTIRVNGTQQATGTAVTVDAVAGGTVTVDFDRGAPPGYHPLPGTKIADSRSGLGVPKGRLGKTGLELQVAGQGGVPASGVGAVALRVLALEPRARGSLSLYGSGGTTPPDPDVLFRGLRPGSGLVIVPLGANGKVHIAGTRGWPHVVVAAAGWFPEGGTYTPLAQTRIADTRICARLWRGSCATDVQVAGRGGMPATGVGTAVLKVGAADAWRRGSLSVHGTGAPAPPLPTLSYGLLRPVSGLVFVPVDENGKVRVTASGASARMTMSVVGWLPPGALTAVSPDLVVNTRAGLGAPRGKLAHGGTVELQVTGRGGVPAAGVGAVALQLAADDGTGRGALTAFPSDAAPSEVPDFLYSYSDLASGVVLVRPGADGRVRVTNAGARTHVRIAIAGWLPES